MFGATKFKIFTVRERGSWSEDKMIDNKSRAAQNSHRQTACNFPAFKWWGRKDITGAAYIFLLEVYSQVFISDMETVAWAKRTANRKQKPLTIIYIWAQISVDYIIVVSFLETTETFYSLCCSCLVIYCFLPGLISVYPTFLRVRSTDLDIIKI